jgi:hypothetical protein
MYFAEFKYNSANDRFDYVGPTGQRGFIDSKYYGEISNCTNEASLAGYSGNDPDILETDRRLGGIAGTNGGLISGSTSGTVPDGGGMSLSQAVSNPTRYDAGKCSYVGGITGFNSGNIVSSMNVASVGATLSGAYIGGIAGENSLNIRQCYNSGSITSTGETDISNKEGFGCDIGGITGRNSDTILSCYNTGRIKRKGHRNRILCGAYNIKTQQYRRYCRS